MKPINRLTMAAGPNSIHPRIRKAYSRQLLYHYDPIFLDLYQDTLQKLKQVFQTNNDVVIMHGEAVLALEAASASAVHPGDRCLNLVSGLFGAGYARYFRRFSGTEPIEIKVPYNTSIDPSDVEKVLNKEGNIRALAVVHSETTAGTINPVKEICELAQNYGVLTIVDAVSSFAGMPVPVDEWNADICIAGPHKCLGAAPGSAIVSVSRYAWERMLAHPNPLRKSYLSLLDWKESWIDEHRFPFTVFVSQIYGVHEAVTMVLEEGLQPRIQRHTDAANQCRRGIESLGLELWPARENIMATCVTAIKVPSLMNPNLFIDHMRDKYNIAITGSLKELDGKLIRIGHMGYTARRKFIRQVLNAAKKTLYDLGL